MSLPLIINGITYLYPQAGDVDWGPDATDWAVAVTSGMLQKSGGAFTLTADVDFGATYGLKSVYYKSRTANVSSTGSVRLAKTDFIGWRDNANANDLELGVNASDQLTFNGNPIIPSTPLTASRAVVTDSDGALTTAATTATEIGYVNGVTSAIQTQLDAKQTVTLTDAHILVGNASNVAASVAMSGDISISNTGVTAIGSGVIVNADINASAAIDFSKLATLTSTNILVGSSGNVATSVAMSGDITIGNTGVTAIGANKVTLAMMAQISTATFLGRTTASTGNVEDLTATQATALLNAMVGDSGSGGTKGLAPAPAAGDAAAGKFLKADGTWIAPSGAGDVVGPSSSHAGGLVLFDGTTGKLLKESTVTQHNMLTSGANGTVSSVAPSTAGKVAVSDGTDWTSASLQGNSSALKAPTVQSFASTGSTVGYRFTVTSANATIGATYTNNGNTYTVIATISGATTLYCSQAAAPQASGTLTKASGTGDSTITFSAAATYATYTTPSGPSPLYIRVRNVGGGGGGSGSSTAAANDGGDGGNGGNTTFGTYLLTANGGAGALHGNTAGTAGGTATIASPAYGSAFVGGSTASGPVSTVAGGTALFAGGSGAASPFGGAGGGSVSGQHDAAANSGSGGSGGSINATTTARSAGHGGSAGGFIDAIIPSPSPTYPYTVGSAGTAGSAGTSGNAGGGGGGGYIEVTEYYQ